jgi:hypothetical protein
LGFAIFGGQSKLSSKLFSRAGNIAIGEGLFGELGRLWDEI